ncbi:hypothetical protein D3C87_1633270 [compost metagenome]
MRIAREHAYHIVDRGGADIDVDAVGAQCVHQAADFLMDTNAMEVGIGHHTGLARQCA